MQIKNNSKIIVINNRGMGDCIVSLSAIKYLKTLGDFSEVYFGVSPRHIDLFRNPAFENIIPISFDFRTLKGVIRAFKDISAINPDYIIELSPVRRTGKIIKAHKLIMRGKYEFFSRKNDTISWLPGLANKDCLSADVNDVSSVFDRDNYNVDSAIYLPKALDREELSSRPYIIVSMASSCETHMPSVEAFIDIVKEIKERYANKKIVYLSSSSSLDQKVKSQVMSYRIEMEYLETDLISLPHIFNESCLFFGMDTGIKHLAAYLGVPTFSYIPEKSYPYSHPYSKPHSAVKLKDSKKKVFEEFDKWGF